MGKLMRLPSIGCYSHRLNLAVEKFSEPYNEIISKLHNLMKKLGNSKKSAALRKKTDLRPILNNDTPWSSKRDLLKRYKELKPFIDSMDAEIAQILPTPAEDIELKKLYQNYLKFESTSKTLQQEKSSIDLPDARELFDSLIEQIGKLHPAVHYRDNTENSICRYVAFENSLVTLLNQLPLTAEQEVLLHVFNPSMEVETADTTACFADQVSAKN